MNASSVKNPSLCCSANGGQSGRKLSAQSLTLIFKVSEVVLFSRVVSSNISVTSVSAVQSLTSVQRITNIRLLSVFILSLLQAINKSEEIYRPCVSLQTLTHCLPPGKHWSAVSLLGGERSNTLVKNQTDLWHDTVALNSHTTLGSHSCPRYVSPCSFFKQEMHQIKTD